MHKPTMKKIPESAAPWQWRIAKKKSVAAPTSCTRTWKIGSAQKPKSPAEAKEEQPKAQERRGKSLGFPTESYVRD